MRRRTRPAGRGTLAILAALAMLWLAACSANDPLSSMIRACVPPDSSVLSVDFDATALAGAHVLLLVADAGELAGQEATGRLELRAYGTTPGPRSGGDAAVLYGTIDVDLAGLGAADTGSLSSDAAEAPGALVLQWRDAAGARPGVLIRLGSRSNRADQLTFEGPFTVFRVLEAETTRFTGRWESGTPAGTVATGRFCASREES